MATRRSPQPNKGMQDFRPGGSVVALHDWSAGRLAAISATWAMLVLAYSVWLDFSTGTISQFKGPDIEGFAVVTEERSLLVTLLAAFVPPVILLVVWARSGKQ